VKPGRGSLVGLRCPADASWYGCPSGGLEDHGLDAAPARYTTSLPHMRRRRRCRGSLNESLEVDADATVDTLQSSN